MHNKERGREVTKTGRAIYHSKRWLTTRKRKLHDQPLCERCGDLATEVHHREGVERQPWALETLESLCKPCHSQITRREQIIRG